MTKPLYFAAIDCPHSITDNSVILHFDTKQPGHNALNQLGARLDAAQTKDSAIASVLEERQRQDAQWGGPETDDSRSLADWGTYIQKQHSELLMQAIFPEPDMAESRERLVKIAALAVSAIASIDRKQGEKA